MSRSVANTTQWLEPNPGSAATPRRLYFEQVGSKLYLSDVPSSLTLRASAGDRLRVSDESSEDPARITLINDSVMVY